LANFTTVLLQFYFNFADSFIHRELIAREKDQRIYTQKENKTMTRYSIFIIEFCVLSPTDLVSFPLNATTSGKEMHVLLRSSLCSEPCRTKI